MNFQTLKSWILAFGLILVMSWQIRAQIAISLPTIDATTLTTGSVINVPLTVVTGASGITSIQLTIGFDPAVLTPVVQSANVTGLVNPSPLTTSGGASWFAGAGAGNAIAANWLDPSFNGISLPNGTVLFQLQFTYLGGETPLNFSTTPNSNVFYNTAFQPIPLTSTNGGIFAPVTGPTVTSLAADAITQTQATLNGEINPDNNTLAAFFEYGTTTAYGQEAAAGNVQGSTSVNVNAAISGLAPNTFYHFRLVALNGTDSIHGADLSFTTLPTTALPPTVTSLPATAISSMGATLNGSVNANGAPADVVFEYGLTSSLGQTLTASPANVTGQTTTSVTANLASLSPGTSYFFRLKATNSEGTNTGDILSFTTLPANQIIIEIGSISTPPAPETVVNIPVTMVAGGSGIGSMQFGISFDPTVLTPVEQSPTNAGLVNPAAQTTANGGDWLAGAGTGNSISPNWYDPTFAGISLPDGTVLFELRFTYHGGSTNLVFDLATSLVYNANFEEYDVVFINGTIGNPAPVAITLDAELSGTTATLNGIVNANDAETTVSFEYGLTNAYGTEIPALESPVNGILDVNVSAEINALQTNTIYHFRVKAVNAAGTSYGQNKTFQIIGWEEIAGQDFRAYGWNGTVRLVSGSSDITRLVQLFDLSGRQLAQARWNAGEELVLPVPMSGVYFTRVSTETQQTVHKVIVK